MQLNITKRQAQLFLTYQGGSDITALEYLASVLRYKSADASIRVIRAAEELNGYVELMELGEIPSNSAIDCLYRNLMYELVAAAQKIVEEE